MDQFVIENIQPTLRSDSLATSHPVYVPVQHPDEIYEIFDLISYGKVSLLSNILCYDKYYSMAIARQSLPLR